MRMVPSQQKQAASEQFLTPSVISGKIIPAPSGGPAGLEPWQDCRHWGLFIALKGFQR